MGRSVVAGLAAASMMLSVTAVGASPLGSGPEFSAEQVQVAADGKRTVIQKMYVGNDHIRFEQGGDSGVVMIADTRSGKGWRVVESERSYMEVPLPPKLVGAAGQNQGAGSSPCAGWQGVTCSKHGEEEVNGRVAEKWEFRMSGPGGEMNTHHWIDQQRRFPVRHEMPNGALFEARMVAVEDVGGRKAERWEHTTKQGERVETSTVWYDPELGLNIREVFPGGVVRELSNIQLAAQPAELFQLPADYERRQPPPMPPHQGGMGRPPMPGMQR